MLKDVCCDGKAIYYVEGRSFGNNIATSYEVTTIWRQPLDGRKRERVWSSGRKNNVMSLCPGNNRWGLWTYLYEPSSSAYVVAPPTDDQTRPRYLIETDPQLEFLKQIRAGGVNRLLMTKTKAGNKWVWEFDLRTRQQRQICQVEEMDYYRGR